MTTPLVAWRVRPCRFCGRPAGQRCRTATDQPTSAHASRLDDFAGWLARQPEVDDLDAKWRAVLAELDKLAVVLETAEAAREDAIQDAAGYARLLDAEKTAHGETRTVAAREIANLRGSVSDLTDEVASLKAWIEANTPDPTPTTLFGACILTGGAAGVVSKWGRGASVRQFMGSALSVPVIPTDSLMHVSYKPPTSVADVNIDSMLKVAAQATGPLLVTIRHEPDNDGMTAAQIAEWKALNNRVYARNVALGRPCLIAPTFTGGLFASYSTDAERDVWMDGVKGDLLGIDCDGVHDNQTTKPADLIYRRGGKVISYADEVANAKRYIAKFAANGWTGVTAPEWGISRATWDTTGEGRAKFIRTNGDMFIAEGLYAVQWYDFRDTKTGISDIIDVGSPEYAALREYTAARQ